MHQHPEVPEFMKTVKEIKEAEEEHDRVIASSKDKAAKIVRDAREKASSERVKADEEIVAIKNERVKKGSAEIEGEVEKIIRKAREEGAKTSRKGLDAAAVSRLVKEFLASL